MSAEPVVKVADSPTRQADAPSTPKRDGQPASQKGPESAEPTNTKGLKRCTPQNVEMLTTNERNAEKHRKLAPHEGFNSERYIKAYLGLSGDQVCLEGVGTGANFGTFPRSWTVDSLLESAPWVKVLKCPSEKEDATPGVHYEQIEPLWWRPKTVILNRKGTDPLITVRGDSLGGRKNRAEFITVLSSATTAIAVQGEPAECPSLEDVQTPASPPMIASP